MAEQWKQSYYARTRAFIGPLLLSKLALRAHIDSVLPKKVAMSSVTEKVSRQSLEAGMGALSSQMSPASNIDDMIRVSWMHGGIHQNRSLILHCTN